jgi:outer membrane protein assembly factor BamD
MKFVRDGLKGILRMRSIIALAAVVLLFGGCGTNLREFYFDDLFGKKSDSAIDKTAEQLAVEGMQKMQKKDYEDAVDDFKKLKEHYPYSKYAILAELKLGDAYYHDKRYSEAALAYEEFVRLHPRNEVVPYVLYQIGMSHFLLFSSVDRDPEETQLALQSFQKVVQVFPNSEYASKAEKQIQECKKRIASHSYNVAKFYYTIEEYAAAKSRLEEMVQKYPQAVSELGFGKSVDQMLAKCQTECAKGEKDPGIWTRLGF